MALCQLLNRYCNSPNAVFRTIRDFLAAADGIDVFTASGSNPGPGYEIVDAFYASGDPNDTTTGDWCVLRTTGEADTYPHYLRFAFGATAHQLTCWLHWNPETHAGFCGGNVNTLFHNGAGQVILHIHANRDEVHIVIRPQAKTVLYWCCVGRLTDLAYSGAAVQSPGAVAAGADTVIPLDAWPDWAEPGRKVYNWDTSSLHELTITAVDPAARTITVAASQAKAAGSWLAEDLCLFWPAGSEYSIQREAVRYVVPSRAVVANLATSAACTVGWPFQARGFDDKYGRRIAISPLITVSITNNPVRCEYRGRLRLLRVSDSAPASQGEAWTDERGEAWRLYNVYENRTIALREAV